LRYVVLHPNAKDTLQGIVRWWRPQGSTGWPEPELEEALAFCVRRDWVMVRDVAPGVGVYGANPRRLVEMEQFLGQVQNNPEGDKKE
jgi:hypothetical protein